MDRYFRIAKIEGKLILTLLMSLLSVVLVLLLPTADRRLCCAAMLCGTAGDLLLMNYGEVQSALRLPRQLYGSAFFAAGHLFYALAFLSLAAKRGGTVQDAMSIGAVLFVLTLGAGLILFLRNGGKKVLPMLGMSVYLLFLCASSASALLAALALGGLRWVSAAGGALFFASDVLIGYKCLTGKTELNRFVWWLYPIGQILLLIGG